MFYTYLIYSKIKFAYIIKKVAKIKFFQQGKFKNQAFFGSSAKWIGGVV